MRAAATAFSCLLLASACTSTESAVTADGRISRPNEYVGWSAPTYDGHQRSSFYVDMRDGTKLAVDLYRPTKAGVVASEKLPVIWMHTPYNRRA
jgi:predicted acyl esterase